MSAAADAALEGLLRQKEFDFVEVEMQLFENCNLQCAFCSQDHNASLEQASQASLMRKADFAIEYMKLHRGRHFKFNLMGGEIFQDRLPDDLFERLYAIVEKIATETHAAKKTARFMFTTNFIFEKGERVEALLQKIETQVGPVQLATSFDFQGRGWTSAQRDLFKKNVERWQHRVRLVGVVLHRFSIKKMMEEGDPLFDWLYERVPVVFEYYIPDLYRHDRFSPSDEENLAAWRYLAKHYPNAEPIKRWLNSPFNEVKCCSPNRLTILADETVSTCRYFPYEAEDFKTALDRHSISAMALNFINEQGCLSCEHFHRCGLHCFVQADRVQRKKKEDCFIREFFDENLNRVPTSKGKGDQEPISESEIRSFDQPARELRLMERVDG